MTDRSGGESQKKKAAGPKTQEKKERGDHKRRWKWSKKRGTGNPAKGLRQCRLQNCGYYHGSELANLGGLTGQIRQKGGKANKLDHHFWGGSPPKLCQTIGLSQGGKESWVPVGEQKENANVSKKGKWINPMGKSKLQLGSQDGFGLFKLRAQGKGKKGKKGSIQKGRLSGKAGWGGGRASVGGSNRESKRSLANLVGQMGWSSQRKVNGGGERKGVTKVGRSFFRYVPSTRRQSRK